MRVHSRLRVVVGRWAVCRGAEMAAWQAGSPTAEYRCRNNKLASLGVFGDLIFSLNKARRVMTSSGVTTTHLGC